MTDDTRPVTIQIQIPRPQAGGGCSRLCKLNELDQDGDHVGCEWSYYMPGYFYRSKPGPGCPWYEEED